MATGLFHFDQAPMGEPIFEAQPFSGGASWPRGLEPPSGERISPKAAAHWRPKWNNPHHAAARERPKRLNPAEPTPP